MPFLFTGVLGPQTQARVGDAIPVHRGIRTTVLHRILGLVVKTFASRVVNPGFDSRSCREIFLVELY